MSIIRSLDDLLETLQSAKERGRGCTLLIGAGCSVDAGIPVASGFVECIREKHPRAYERAGEKTYPACMAQLTPDERRHLIAHYVDIAKINWSHICIALLMHGGYVDRVLTTNFDPLVVRACALLGDFPAVYDFAASHHFKPADIPDKALFYLHGQRSGFVLLNTREEVASHSIRLGPVFEDAGRGRMWIVVGYSGDNDPVFEHLACVERFDNGLYWIGYQDGDPPIHVRENLLLPERDGYYIPGYDSNSFFITLTQRLGLFPPPLISRPFSHLRREFEELTPFQPPSGTTALLSHAHAEDVTELPLVYIREAIASYEEQPSASIVAVRLLMRGDYEGLLALVPTYKRTPSPALAVAISWAYVMRGTLSLEKSMKAVGDEAERLLELAASGYSAALSIKVDSHEALCNLGIVFLSQARRRPRDESLRLLDIGAEKIEAALALKPDCVAGLSNLGAILHEQGLRKAGDEADRLFQRACDKFDAAIAIQPDRYETLFNWGVVLKDRACAKTGKEAVDLFQRSEEKYRVALGYKSDDPDVFQNLSEVLLWKSHLGDGAEVGGLLRQAEEVSIAAEALARGAGAYNLACVRARLGDNEGCQRWLDVSRKAGKLPALAHLEADPDLKSVHDTDWFQELLRSLGPSLNTDEQ